MFGTARALALGMLARTSSTLIAVVSSLSVGCGSSVPTPPDVTIRTILSGQVTLDRPIEGSELVVRDEGPRGAPLGAATTGSGGTFEIDLGPLSGPVWIEASTPGSASLATWRVTGQGEAVGDVQVSPMTTLAVAWMQGALRRGMTPDTAWSRAEAMVFDHLGGVDHRGVAPTDLRGDLDVPVDDGARAGLILHGFAEQAARWSRRSEGQGSTPVTLAGLTAAYARDLEDGLADGKDRFGARVSVGAVDLTPDSLRLDLAMAITAFLDGPSNGTALRSRDVEDLLSALREARGSLFPEGSLAERDLVGPTASWSWRRDGEVLAADSPVAGIVELMVMAADPSGVARLDVFLESTSLGSREWVERATWSIDAGALEDGRQAVTVFAKDGLGSVSTSTTSFVVDRTAPRLELDVAAQVDTPTVAVVGRWFDGSGVSQVILRIAGEEEIRLAGLAPEFEVTVPVICGSGEATTIEGTAVDVAGNVSSPTAASVRCVAEGPSLVLLPSSVIDERQAVFEHGPDGMLLGVRFPASPPRSALDESAVWPVPVYKHFTRLDLIPGASYETTNLPVFRGRASGTRPMTARFRTFVDGTERRPWAVLGVDPAGRLDLPVSYQTFGPDLVTAGASAVHAADIEVVDASGEAVVRRVEFRMEVLGPPIWVGGCAPIVTPADLRLGFAAAADMDLLDARVRWDLGTSPGSEAPIGPARLIWHRDPLGAEISALGEDTWHAADFDPGNAPDLGCWVQHSSAGFLHEVRSGPGQGGCGAGLYPPETLDAFVAGRDGRLSRTASLALVHHVTRASWPVVPDAQGQVEIRPLDLHDVRVRIQQPVLRLPDGGPYTWPTAALVPPGHRPSVQAQGRARYPLVTFERAGVDYRRNPFGGRPFVTRTFVQRVRLDVPALDAEAHLPVLGIDVPVFVDAACGAAQVLEVSL